MSIETPAAIPGDVAPPAYAGAAPKARARTLGLARIDVLLAIAFFVLAMVPRTAWIEYNDRAPQGLNDPTLYLYFADSIANGTGYTRPTGEKIAYYPVGYPAALGGFRKAQDLLGFDRTIYSGKMFNGVLGAATVSIIYLLALRVLNRKTAIVAALLLTIFPGQVFYTGAFLSEPLFTFLLALAMLVLLWNPWPREGLPYGQLAAVGLLLSAATMTRGITLTFPLVLFAVWFFYMHSRKRALIQTAVLFAGIAVFIVPWSIRNTLAFDTLVGPSTNVGDDLCIGNYRGSGGRFTIEGKCFEGYEGMSPSEVEIARNRDGTKIAIKDVLNYPARMPVLVAHKAYWLLYKDDDGLWAVESYGNDWFIEHPMREILSFAANSIYYAAMALAALGILAFMFARDIRRLIVALVALYIIAVPLAFFGDPRFHYPAIPFFVIIAAATLVALWDERKRFRASLRPAATAIAPASPEPQVPA